MSEAFARDRSFWLQLKWGVVAGIVSIAGTLLFVLLMNTGIDLLWPDEPSPDAFSGSVRILIIMTAAGVLVGLVHRFAKAEEENVFEAIVKGRLDPRSVPSAILVALVSLIGGYSLGPEVPAGMLAGGASTWLSERKNLDPETKRSTVLSGVMGSYSGLFTSPFAALVMPLELAHGHTPRYYGTLTIAVITAVMGFGVFFALAGEEYADVIRILDLPDYRLKVWHLIIAVGFGVVGAALALVFALLFRSFKKLAAPLNSRPVVRGTVGGILLGLLGMALPLTLFLGTTGLVTVTEQGVGELGLAFVIIMVFAKMVATTGALATGFIGGPIFPLLFVGGTAGTAVNYIFPDIPLALAVPCLMAALPGALLPVPLALTVIVLLIVGTPAQEAAPVFLSVIVAYFITHGLGLLGAGPAEKEQSHE